LAVPSLVPGLPGHLLHHRHPGPAVRPARTIDSTQHSPGQLRDV